MPQNLLSSANCRSEVLTSTWDRAEGALAYTVEAWGNKDEGNRYNCSSFTNSCAIPSVHCGESLTMYITAFDDNCPSYRTLGRVAETVPCAPQNVSAAMYCGSDSITLNWQVSYGSLFYIATAMDDAGVVHTCNSMDTKCQIKGLRCSSTYNAFVTATNLKCNSSDSEIVTVETAPCLPDHIEAFLNCAANNALIVWQGHHSILSYTATIEDTEGGLLSCSTTGNNCTVPSLKCGQLYSVSVMHHDGICPSIPSQAITMESAPCGPANVQTEMDCGSGTLTVSWDTSLRALGYTTIISHGNREQVTCNSTATSCSVDTLDCGEEYVVEVMSVNRSCLSMPSQAMVIREVPCVPTNVTAHRTCGESPVAVTWDASRGAKIYTAIAMGNSGHRTECTSNDTTCSLEDLLCGQTYSLSVLAVDDACSSTESSMVTLETVPCPPTHVSSWVDCGSNTASLSWDASPNAISYSGSAVGTDGHRVSCGAATPGCQMVGLHCGQEYVFTVSASDGSCESPESNTFTQETAPCAPQSVVNSLFCRTNTLSVSWAPAAIALNNSVTAMAGDGTALSCTTEGRTCELDGLQCGQQYTLAVTATSSNCTGTTSAPQTVQTVPCVPSSVHGVVDCASNTLQASWDATDGAHAYISTVTGPDSYTSTCSTANLTCFFTGLECAKEYSVSVVAKDDQCNSSVSVDVSVATAPCDPENVASLLQCSSGVVTVSWEASAGATGYTASAQEDGETHFTSCSTTGTSCDLTQLECGEVYTMTVVARDGICNSTLLATTTIETVPCPPTIKDHSLDCASNQAYISWVEDDDAVGFLINASSALGHTPFCSSTNTSCLLDDLLCGQTYTVHAIAQGDQCNSEPSESFEIVTAPCTPANVRSQYECGTSIALLSWDETLGRDSFIARVESGDHSDSCSTTETQCSLTTLMCGHLYNVTVDALAGHCNSSQSAATQIQTARCAPQNVSASLLCRNNTVAVTWLASSGAVGYNVTALGRDGDAKTCTTDDTSCDLPNMHCAQTYEITITPFSETCKGFQSTAFTFIAGPCPPTEVQTSLQCESNVGSVSWVAAPTSKMYIATATDQNGHAHTCITNGTAGCSFSDLKCGETYNVSVVTMERGCQSEPSAPVTLKASICPPTSLAGVTACGTNDLTITWDQNSETGVTYFLYSQKEGGANTSYSTVDTSYVISGLQCGEHYSFRVTAKDSVCTSSLSSTMEMDTAPCPPTNLTAQANCSTNGGTITWDLSAGGVTYTATVTGTTHSLTAFCTSNATSCSVKLDCGHPYSASVVASTGTCNSTMDTIQFDSAPCLPGNVAAALDCSANTFAVQWSEREGHRNSYTALAIGSDGSNLSCGTSSTTCTINSLACGITYSIAVSTANVNCATIEGSDYRIQSAPCKPESPAVSLECSTNVAEVTWDNAGPDQIHMVSAVDWQGVKSSCNSTGSNCTFSSLSCGQAYTVTVQGLTDTCKSKLSTSMNLLTAPCVPTHLTADVDCEAGITSVTWDSARGATGYTVHAEGSGGHNATCTSSDTNCAFLDLVCGQDYTMVVLANHDSCVSLASESITTTTLPCRHTGLQAYLDCSTNTAQISWTSGNGTLIYKALAEGFDIKHQLTCSSPGSGCNISKLQCGERYRVSVRGEGRTCPSPARDWVVVNTAPCPPTALSVQSSCSSDNISVSWAASQGSVSYTAIAVSNEGHWLSCNTSTTACDISGLLCGQEYKVYAAGVDNSCVGAKSNIYIVNTAPCAPTDVQNALDCLSGVLTITWQQSGYTPNHYHAELTSSESLLTVCDTNVTTCMVSRMQCGLTYSVVVLAHDDVCNSSYSPAQQVTAAPCPPDAVSAVVDCATNVVTVTWDNSVAEVLYTVTAECPSGQHYTCNVTGMACDLSTLSCGTEYNVTVTPSHGGCVGVNTPSQLVKTAPCVPRLTEVEMDCLSDSAWVVWEESAGAELYVAVATDSQGQTFECNSTDSNTCAVPDLHCGLHFNFTLTALDQQCSSAPSNAVVSETAPCPPQDTQTKVGCENHTVSVSWTPSVGALMYTATLERTDGETTFCTTDGTGCDITQLPCGEMYVLAVTAEGRTCNTSESMGTIVRTVPCTPQRLQASVSCSSNVANMMWNTRRGGQLYSVEATGTDGHVAGCMSHETRCDLTGLHCGQHYTATMVAQDSDCTSPVSDTVELKTAPCIPATVSTVMDCAANAMYVSWSKSSGADSYLATLQDSDGSSTTCQALSGAASCNVTTLSCGQIYHVTVAASNGSCSSPSTDVTDTHTAPCAPRNIETVMDCEARVAMVSWSMSAGTVSYVATATTLSGHAVTCETSDTFCELGGLACGESYSVSVQAQGESCSSMATMTGQLVTEPCVPFHLSAKYSLTIGQVLWDVSQGATLYSAEAVTEEGHLISCNTSDTYCALYNMACSQVYNVTVTAHNNICQGMATSKSINLKTEPCPPNNVETSIDCETGTGAISWEMSVGALGYIAFFNGRNGDSLSCHTLAHHTSCRVEGLNCGTVYYARVRALGDTLNSTDSTTVLLASAPCVPASIEAEVDCDNATALVTWGWSNGAQSYILTAMGSDGHQASCHTEENYCNMPELACGEDYDLTLTAINHNCQVETLTGVSFSTRPCVPLHVGVDLQCGTHTATLSWEQREGLQFYVASATSRAGGSTGSCNTGSSSCQFPALDCGETYSFTVTAHSSLCQSELSNTVEIKTEPCQPDQVTATGSCDSETMVVVAWAEAEGAVVYMVTAMGDLGYMTAFQTNESSLEAELPCGQTYSFTVIGQDESCDSPISDAAKFRTAPCVPQHVESYTVCENSLGSVSWAESEGAESYTAVAVGTDGHTHMCTTNSTSCTWEDLHCGDLYTVHVISNDYLCSSSPSNSTTVRTAPCVPQNLVPTLDCGRRVGSLTWDLSHGADFYMVTAETNAGHKVELSTNDTNAYISEFQCGQEYYLSVQAVDSECRSAPSPPATLRTEPCNPTSISSTMDCLSNIAMVTWAVSDGGAEYYTATVEHEDGQSKSCMSSSFQCGMPDLRCGQNYTVTVTASNQHCHSDHSVVNTLTTVPCVPTHVVAIMDCSDNTAAVTWSPTQGALSYRAVAQSPHGAISSCESTDPQCILANLICGEPYTVQVVAVNERCSSLPSHMAEFQTVPCTPEITGVLLDCYTDSALLEWAYAGGTVSYTATAQSGDGQTATCNTNHTNCKLMELACGQTYTVTLRASDGQCDSFQSTSVKVSSVPCPPQAVVSQLNCLANSARVEWETSSGVDSYTVQAMSMEGDVTGCETDGNVCSISDLVCGSTYNISVNAVSNECNVSESAIIQMQTVPCVPEQLEANMDCDSGSVSVSWKPSNGATSYTAVAQGNGGYASSCNSSDTSCQFPELLCGLSYSITVQASDDVCNSADSSAVQLNTLLCEPQNVSAQMECGSNAGLVSWEQGELVSSYLVRAVSPNGHLTQCDSNATSCRLPNMHCGQQYNLTVTAQDGSCDNSNAYLTLQSVPCNPTNVQASLQCLSNSAAVTWERASGAVLYQAVGTTDGGHQAMCNNSQTHCDLSGLQCGQTYNVTVVSEDDTCSSVDSDKAQVRTAPCPSQDVAVDVQCAAGSMMVTWSANPNAESFHVTAVTSGSADLSCDSRGHPIKTGCSIENLPCGHLYSVTVTSIRGGCKSKVSGAVAVSSAPCVPQNAKGSLDCISNSVWVSWDASTGAQTYTVLANGGGGVNSTCTSYSTACNVPDLACGTQYTFHVTAVNTHCQSSPSNTFQIETGPCSLKTITAVNTCNSSSIVVSWEHTELSPTIVATAEGQDQSMFTCNSTSTSCELMGVRCGMHYTIIVSVPSDKCSTLRSPPKKINTAPCVPEDVTVVASCKAEGTVVSWAHSLVAQSYLLTATSRGGDVRTCNSSMNKCTLDKLHCGQPYTFSVTASASTCTSQASPNVTFSTAPCDPIGLSVHVQCETSSGVLSWSPSQGSVGYYGFAQSEDGDMLYCDSMDTSCTIQGLDCGAMYNFSVLASDGACNSSYSQPLLEGAAPCAPATVRNRMQLIGKTHFARTSWSAVVCPNVEYLVEMTGSILEDPQAMFDVSSYWIKYTFFELALPCGSSYSLTVRTRNSAGTSKPSTPVTGTTAPCAPLAVNYTGDNTPAMLSWEAAVFATRYTVYDVTGDGRTQVCSTTELSCQLNNVQPGAIEVTASNAVGESVPTKDINGPSNRHRRDLGMAKPAMFADFRIREELTEPKVLVATVTGVSLHMEWAPVRDATLYTIIIVQEDTPSRRQVLTVSEELTNVNDLEPSTRYCIFVSAKNEYTQSNYSKECVTTGVPM
ncbi:mucin-3B [Salvelinus alpinus]|uniref:mucin-3B n=1 Tax=Salvelinus alpinus TaxID=8036 RepID=UPI0039FBA6C2